MRRGYRKLAIGLTALLLAGCASGPASFPTERAFEAEQTFQTEGAFEAEEIARGRASWYGNGFQGRRTASGERFDMNALTAAHPSLPFGTQLMVRNPNNGREVIVRINDRGPHTGGRIIDLSRAAAKTIGLLEAGVGTVVLLRP